MDQKRLINILLIEDNQTDVKIILRAFERAKFTCNLNSVEDGQEALEYLLNKGKYSDSNKFPRPDILLLDVNMPRMDGHTFVKEIKTYEEFKSIPIIVFTTNEGMQGMFKIEGVDDYIQKSLDAANLISRIKYQVSKNSEDF